MKFLFFCISLLILSSCSTSKLDVSTHTNTYSGVINKRLIWQGNVTIDKDLLIDDNGEVIVAAGTVVNVIKSDISRTEPVFLYPETEILVKGKFIINGTKENPVIFQSAEINKDRKDWAGIILQKGVLKGKNFVIRDAYNAIAAINGNIEINDLVIEQGYIGVSLLEYVTGEINRLNILNCQTGMILDNSFTQINNVSISKNNEGLIVKKAPKNLFYFKIYDNIFGVILSKQSLPLLINDNKVYENKNNLFIFDAVSIDK